MEWMLLLERRQQGKESLHLQKKKPFGRILRAVMSCYDFLTSSSVSFDWF